MPLGHKSAVLCLCFLLAAPGTAQSLSDNENHAVEAAVTAPSSITSQGQNANADAGKAGIPLPGIPKPWLWNGLNVAQPPAWQAWKGLGLQPEEQRKAFEEHMQKMQELMRQRQDEYLQQFAQKTGHPVEADQQKLFADQWKNLPAGFRPPWAQAALGNQQAGAALLPGAFPWLPHLARPEHAAGQVPPVAAHGGDAGQPGTNPSLASKSGDAHSSSSRVPEP